jgi:hypothetical protein
VRHILSVLILGATVALGATAAFAYGDGLEYPGPGIRQTVTTMDTQPRRSDSGVMAGSVQPVDSSESSEYWTTFHFENIVR